MVYVGDKVNVWKLMEEGQGVCVLLAAGGFLHKLILSICTFAGLMRS